MAVTIVLSPTKSYTAKSSFSKLRHNGFKIQLNDSLSTSMKPVLNSFWQRTSQRQLLHPLHVALYCTYTGAKMPERLDHTHSGHDVDILCFLRNVLV